MRSQCTIAGCDRCVYAKTLCGPHYQRVRDGRSLLTPIRPHGLTPAERYLSKVDRTSTPDGCWPWTDTLSTEGYGSFYDGVRPGPSHVFGYTLLVGSIPDGFHIDHICHNTDPSCPGGRTCRHRSCQRPGHWEAVEPIVNALRGKSPMAINARKTHCPKGHPYDDANTMLSKDGRGRKCRICHREKGSAWYWSTRRSCTITNCDAPVKANNLCTMHYKRQRKGTDLLRPPRAPAGTYRCSSEDCERDAWSRGMCRMHHARWYRAHRGNLPPKP